MLKKGDSLLYYVKSEFKNRILFIHVIQVAIPENYVHEFWKSLPKIVYSVSNHNAGSFYSQIGGRLTAFKPGLDSSAHHLLT